ncbi:MAG: hypothetical protein CSA15_00100 [Candidatus Delongbacteria bacterium]|nr:MAG: hypothetical protein CSA15_00100 [Candidatus Delongbacteria bacterium]
MKCEKCGAPEVAVKAVIQDQSGNVKNVNLCSNCFQELSDNKFDLSKLNFEKINEIMSSALDKIGSVQEKCRRCGLTLNEYKKFKSVGCPECYNTYRDYIREDIFKMTKTHCLNDDIKDHDQEMKTILEDRLKKAIENEEFELAASLKIELDSK